MFNLQNYLIPKKLAQKKCWHEIASKYILTNVFQVQNQRMSHAVRHRLFVWPKIFSKGTAVNHTRQKFLTTNKCKVKYFRIGPYKLHWKPEQTKLFHSWWKWISKLW